MTGQKKKYMDLDNQLENINVDVDGLVNKLIEESNLVKICLNLTKNYLSITKAKEDLICKFEQVIMKYNISE